MGASLGNLRATTGQTMDMETPRPIASSPNTSASASPDPDVVSKPSFDTLRRDIAQVRRCGAGLLRSHTLPALRTAAILLDLCDSDDAEPAPLVGLLRQAMDTLGGGSEQEAAEYLLGLVPGSGRWTLTRRRASAAEVLGLQPDTFRKKPEQQVIDAIAEAVLEVLHDAGMRQARTQMAARRHPSDSRLAVRWVERFEAYYRIWTPLSGLAADLEAAIATYSHAPANHYPWDPDVPAHYDPIYQADNYAMQALYHYTCFQLERKRFISRHGGLWLASDAETEQHIADTVYRIGWLSPFTEEDDAWLRRHLADARWHETDHFLDTIQRLANGERLLRGWVSLTRSAMTWLVSTDQLPAPGRTLARNLWDPRQSLAAPPTPEHLAAHPTGQTIRAATDYMDLIDQDWLRIADWYRPGTTPQHRLDHRELWQERVGEY